MKTTDEIIEELGWCGCGDPDAALEYLRDVLNHITSQPKSEAEDLSLWLANGEELMGRAQMLTLYCLAEKGLVEHGGSVSFCWLSAEGQSLLEDLTAHAAAAGRSITSPPRLRPA